MVSASLSLSLSTTSPPHFYTLSLHDALPISIWVQDCAKHDTELDIRFATLSNSIISGECWTAHRLVSVPRDPEPDTDEWDMVDRKSTRLNSSHLGILYAVFCLKKKSYRRVAR